MKWICRSVDYWESADGQWRIIARANGTVVNWRIYHLVDDRWIRSSIKGPHYTLASAKVAVVMFVEDAAR